MGTGKDPFAYDVNGIRPSACMRDLFGIVHYVMHSESTYGFCYSVDPKLSVEVDGVTTEVSPTCLYCARLVPDVERP
jgi:hypothetical protein